MHSEAKTQNLTVRISPDVRAAFYEKASQYGTPSEILRELVVAFIEGRLTIEPPTGHGKKEKLYNVHRE